MSSRNLTKIPSMKSLGKDGGTESPFIPSGLASEVYGENNPPKDWCDVGLLIPHEAIRREMQAMLESVAALDEKYDDTKDDWRILYFSEWFVDVFAITIHSHHENEEEIYFPWIATRAEIPEKKMAKDHEALISLLDKVEIICATVIKKKGKDCKVEIHKLKSKVPVLVKEMNAHLKEEEEQIPQLLRDNFTQAEEQETVEKILKNEGLHGCRIFVPAIIHAMEHWATPKFNKEFISSMPPPIRNLVVNYYMPDYQTYVYPMRDAPILESKPTLSKVGCCGISFCCPCII